MADSLMTAGGTVSAIVPQIWSSNFTQNLRANLAFNDSVARDYEGEIQNLGDRVFIPTLPDGAVASVITEGAQNDAIAIAASTTPLIINKQIVQDFIITTTAQLQSINFMSNLMDIATFAILSAMQNLIIAAIAPSVSPQQSIAYTSGTTLAQVDILAAKRLLDTQNVPDENRLMVAGTGQANDLLNIINLVNNQYNPAVNGGAPSVTGTVNNPVWGFQPKKTTAVGTSSYFFHRSFMQMAVQKQLSMKLYDLGVNGVRGYRLNVDLLFGVVQNFNTRVVKVG